MKVQMKFHCKIFHKFYRLNILHIYEYIFDQNEEFQKNKHSKSEIVNKLNMLSEADNDKIKPKKSQSNLDRVFKRNTKQSLHSSKKVGRSTSSETFSRTENSRISFK